MLRLTEEEIGKIPNLLAKDDDKNICNAQLRKVALWLIDLPTDGWDKRYFYHKELADKILEEIDG